MTTYAQVYSGTAHNVVTGETFNDAVAGKYNDAWVESEISSGRQWSEVPDTDTNDDPLKHGATDNNDGTFTNPVPPVVTSPPVALTKTQFQALYSTNGSDLTATLDAWPEG